MDRPAASTHIKETPTGLQLGIAKTAMPLPLAMQQNPNASVGVVQAGGSVLLPPSLKLAVTSQTEMGAPHQQELTSTEVAAVATEEQGAPATNVIVADREAKRAKLS